MAEDAKLGRDVFIALAAIGWADGNLDSDEADAIVRTALEEGLELEEIVAIEEATKSPVELDSVDLSGMSREDRVFVYAVAAWMTRLDGEVSSGETKAMAKLGKLLDLPEKSQGSANRIAQEVAELEEGDRPDRYDLIKLRKVVGERLRKAEERQSAKA